MVTSVAIVYDKRSREEAWRELVTLYYGGTVPYGPNDREFAEKYGERGFSANAHDGDTRTTVQPQEGHLGYRSCWNFYRVQWSKVEG